MKYVIIGVLLFPSIILAQEVNFQDDFSDEDLSGWSGTTANFTFITENGNTLLQQNTAEAGVSWLSIPSTSVVGYWEFFVRLDGFAPASGNKAEIYLMSDNSDLTAPLNGYKLRAGESGSEDVFRLFRITDGNEEYEILSGITSVASGGDFRVKVSRDNSGNWTLEIAEGYAGQLNIEATGTDNTYNTSTHFGLKNTYTSTRADRFFYDFKIDIPPITVDAVSFISANQIDVIFSRGIDFSSAQTTDFAVDPHTIIPQSVSEENPTTIRLNFSNDIPTGPNQLLISGIDDFTKETTLSDTVFNFTVFDEFEDGDVIINEFLKDPPSGAAEYVELRNTTSKYFNLRKWKIGDSSSLTTISDDEFALFPDSFVVISADTSALNNYFGTGNYIQASLPALNNGSDQIRLFDESEQLVDSLDYDSDWGGVKVAIERIDKSVSAIFRENWGESPAFELGTPGTPNLVEPDDTPPFISELTVRDDQTLVVAFSEQLEAYSAQTLYNYSLSQNPESGVETPSLPEISDVTQPAPDTLIISLDSALEEYKGTWTLEATNLTDIFGNSASDESEFNYYVIFTASEGDVAINEFMYDPADFYTEFIELYNHTDSTFDLQNWTLNDNTGNKRSISNSQYILPSDSFVLLVPDASIAELFPGTPMINMGSRFPALNNGNDAIVIRSSDGTIIDSLSYSSSWGGDEVSLERRTIDVSAVFAENWGDSPSNNLATPGLENEIELDIVPPEVVELSVINEDQIQIIFSERILKAPAEAKANFIISGDGNTSVPNLNSVTFIAPDTVLLKYASAFPRDADGTDYQLTIRNQTDIFENQAGDITEEFFIIDYATADFGEVAISEFMYDPADGFSEFIELHNTSDSTFNLQNWTYNDNSGNRRSISDTEYSLTPGDFVLLTPDSTLSQSFPDTPILSMGNRFSSLNNNTDAIVIRSNNGILIDSLTYSSAWGGDEVSLERRVTNISAFFAENWGESPSADFGTPGAQNQIEEDKTAPSIAKVGVSGEKSLHLIFTERIKRDQAETLFNFSLSSDDFSASELPNLSTVSFAVPDTITLTFSEAFPRKLDGSKFQITIKNQTDIFGNKADELKGEFLIIDYGTAQPGDIAINEFMYDPDDGFSEFIELLNTSDSTINLQEWTYNDNSGNRRTITDNEFALSPEDFVLLTPDSTILDHFPNTPALVMGTGFSSLNNSTDAIVIRSNDGTLIDSLTYSSAWGGDEVSLERRTIDVSAVFAENWGDSPSNSLATPGLENEIELDTSPPEVVNLSVINEDQIQVIFSERILKAPAETKANFIISGDGNITVPNLNSVTFIAPDTVMLDYASAFPRDADGTAYHLTIKNQTDIFESRADDITEEFFIIDYATADFGEVAITEFMYDPADGFSEFIELHNTSDSTFNLQNWTYSDNSGNRRTITGSEFALSPEDFVLLTPDSTILEQFPHTPTLVMGTGFSSLNNNTDAIVIRSNNGILIDSLTYSSAWGGDEVSLERRTIDVSAVFAENWGDSPSNSLATPGLENEIELDTSPPEVVNLSVINEDQIQVIFSERILKAPAEAKANFIISGDGNITVPNLNSVTFIAPDTVMLDYASAFPRDADGTAYHLTIKNQTDIFESRADDITEEFFIIDYATADFGEVAITEFMYDPADGFSEFIELHNTSDSTFNLQNWTYNDNSGNRRTITDTEYALNPQDFVLLTPDSTILDHFPNTPALVMGTGFSSLNNSTDAIVIRSYEGTLIDSLSYSSAWGGDEVSLERRVTNISAIFAENWGDSPSNNLATPGLENEIEEDRTPPVVIHHTILNDSTLQIVFSERIMEENAINGANFEVRGATSAIDCICFNMKYIEPDTILFTYKEKFISTVEGNSYTIIIKNQEDIFGNKQENQQLEVERILLEVAIIEDVNINEFMYDPADGFSDFIELANFTESNFNLKNWTINDGTGNRKVITEKDYILSPNIPNQISGNVYVVLAPDSSLLDIFPDVPIIVMGNNFPALNSSSDAIVIRNEIGELIDSLTYHKNWGGDEISLERKTTDVSGIFSENWADSPSPELATPGKANLIDPDESPPEIESIVFAGNDTIRVTFSERLDSILATAHDNFSISPKIDITTIHYNREELIFELAGSLNDGEVYTLSASNQEDIFGNKSESLSINKEFILISSAQKKEVLVNEILYKRKEAGSPEFIELFNNSSRNFDLSNWTFSDATSSSVIPEGTNIRSGEYVVLSDNEEFVNEINNGGIYLSNFPSLNDDEDAIVIKNRHGELIDSLYYYSIWGGSQGGVSLERKDPNAASNDASNWVESAAENGFSAGLQSSVYEVDKTPPEIIFSKLMPDNKVFVAFSEFVDIEEAEIKLNDEPASVTDFNEANANVVLIEKSSVKEGDPLHISFQNIPDVSGNLTSETSIEVAQKLNPGDVVINEILFDPLANSDDNLPDQTEYIELYNTSDYAISLEGLFLHDEADENEETRSIYPVSSTYKWIPSKSYVLVYAEDQASVFNESKLKKYFDLENQDERFTIRIDRSNLSLSSSGDAIYLADSSGTIIDNVFFDESWHNPNLHSTKGVALEKIDPAGPSNEESNWSSSTEVSGGTPGFQNSIFQEAGTGPEGTGITFSPNPFSPDDDGFDDNLFINYKLDHSDYLLRIRIFDRYGRHVRKLVDGKAAGFEGSLIWDGFTDDGRKNRVGIYIILFEAYNSADGKRKTFKETVVLARKFN